nr:WbqC family protein [uncultured Acetatifactor sp.]
MRLGIMQPYFFPYLGYFSLIKHVDKFILFDTAQFIRHGWIERNRILKPGGGWQYFSVPLCKHSQKTPINKIEINNQISWKSKILAQMVHYKKAPYYEAVIHLLQDIFQEDFKDIVSFDCCSLKKVCDYLDIKTEITVFSTMELHIEDANAPDEWALNICKSLPNTDEYWNPPGGKDFFDINKYMDANINICFQQVNLSEYKQGKNPFEKGLSIIDVMMYNSPSMIGMMLDDFTLL